MTHRHSLERRLRRAELRSRILIAAALAWFGAQGLAPEQEPDVLSARRIEIVNDDGRAVLILGADDHGGQLLVKNASGLRRVAGLQAAENGGSIWITDGGMRSSPVIDLAVDAEGHGTVTVGKNGRSHGTLGSYEGRGFLALRSGDRKERELALDLMVDEGGGLVRGTNGAGDTLFDLHGTAGHGLIEVGAGGQITVLDRNDRAQMSVGCGEEGGVFNLHGSDGAVGAVMAAYPEGRGMVAVGRTGEGMITTLTGDKHSGSGLVLKDRVGRELLRFRGGIGYEGLVLLDPAGVDVASFVRGPDGAGRVRAKGADGAWRELVPD